MSSRRLFTASCLALITSAFTFMVRQNIADDLGADFALNREQIGQVMAAAFYGQAISMFVIAPLCDAMGMGRVALLAFLCHAVGVLATILAPRAPAVSTQTSYWILLSSTFVVGSGNGLVEIFINPLAATLYPKEKTHYMNVLHAWWPGGLILCGLLLTGGDFLTGGQDTAGAAAAGIGWRTKMCLVFFPLAAYGLLCVGRKFPATERVQARVSTASMFLQALRPAFLVWAACMFLTAATELGPNQWQESVLRRTANVSGTLVFVYTSGLMFCLRFFAGPLSHRLSPVGLLTVSAAIAAAGLYWLSMATNGVIAFAAATVFGLGVAYFWPTMLGVTSERFPKGGAFLLGLMGTFANLSIALILPQMGAIYDSYTVANLPETLKTRTVSGTSGEPLPLVVPGDESALPRSIAERIRPAGNLKLSPEARLALAAEQGPDLAAVEQAEAIGAAYAFRWVAVLPCVLVAVFGAVALVDRLRGGYRAVQIEQGGQVEH